MQSSIDEGEIRMNLERKAFGSVIAPRYAGYAVAAAALLFAASSLLAQAKPAMLDVASGTVASYHVQEQFVGIDFPSMAVGTTSDVMGTLVLNPDGSVNSKESKLTVDLRTLKSDQPKRDHYIQVNTLQTAKYPMAVFVPQTIKGIPNPMPERGQAGFFLTGDLTIHGVTKPVTWKGIVTFDGDSGRAATNFNFANFDMTQPKIGRLLRVGDNIELDIVFKFKRA
jgi:polyisoprenoid-binding protein YceI